MALSQRPLKPVFSATVELMQNGPNSFYYLYDDNIWPCQFAEKKKCDIRYLFDFSHAKLNIPSFGFDAVAAGLPVSKAIFHALPNTKGDITARNTCRVILKASVRGGITSGATLLLAKKIATLVVVLEKSLIFKLVAPGHGLRDVNPVMQQSEVVLEMDTLDDAKSSGYESHVPPVAAIESAAWSNRYQEHMDRVIRTIWSTPSLRELQKILSAPDCSGCGFYLALRENDGWWDPEENREAIKKRNSRDMEIHKSQVSPQCYWFPEARDSIFGFKYLQATFDHTLFRNWVEVIARIIELAMASPDEYRGYLETILRIQHSTDQGIIAWEQLMEHVLKLGYRIQDWRDQISLYEQGKIITGLSKEGLLPKLGERNCIGGEEYKSLVKRLYGD